MAFDWHDNLVLAHLLSQQAGSTSEVSDEAFLRAAVGRAYIAAYGHAYRYAVTWLGFQPRSRDEEKGQDHGRLKAFLGQKRRRQVAHQLAFLRSLRNRCDYDDEVGADFLTTQIEIALRAAEYGFQALVPPASSPEAPP